MDEPLSNLDAKLRVQMRAEIAALQKQMGTTTVYVTHDQVEAMTMGHRVAVLRLGELAAGGRPPGPLRQPGQRLRRGIHRHAADDPLPRRAHRRGRRRAPEGRSAGDLAAARGARPRPSPAGAQPARGHRRRPCRGHPLRSGARAWSALQASVVLAEALGSSVHVTFALEGTPVDEARLGSGLAKEAEEEVGPARSRSRHPGHGGLPAPPALHAPDDADHHPRRPGPDALLRPGLRACASVGRPSRRWRPPGSRSALPSGRPPPTSGFDALAAPSVRSAIASDTFYFVMTDRYRDGQPANNDGGRTGSVETTGFDPTSDAYYHGGDLAGLTGRCDPADPSDDGLARIKRLGFTAVWITPPFVQRTVQGSQRRVPRLLVPRHHPARPAPGHRGRVRVVHDVREEARPQGLPRRRRQPHRRRHHVPGGQRLRADRQGPVPHGGGAGVQPVVVHRRHGVPPTVGHAQLREDAHRPGAAPRGQGARRSSTR